MSHTFHIWTSGQDVAHFYEDCAFQMDSIIDFATTALTSRDSDYTNQALWNLITFYSVATGEVPTLNPQYLSYVISAFHQVNIELKLTECEAIETMYDSQLPAH